MSNLDRRNPKAEQIKIAHAMQELCHETGQHEILMQAYKMGKRMNHWEIKEILEDKERQMFGE